MQRVNPTKSYVYRLFDADGRLLYVGCCASAIARLGQHQRRKTWADDIASMTIERHVDAASALAAEREAIAIEHPIHNVIGVQGARRRPGELENELLSALAEGPATQAEMERRFGFDMSGAVASVISRCLRKGLIRVVGTVPSATRWRVARIYALTPADEAVA